MTMDLLQSAPARFTRVYAFLLLTRRHVSLLFCLWLPALISPAHASGLNCSDLAHLSLPHARITIAKMEPDWAESGGGPQTSPVVAPFCRVAATLTPAPDSQIKIEVWMPVSGWNGRYEGLGNGGYGGSILYGALVDSVRHGYAAATTDMGTAPSSMVDGDALIGHPDRWDDWGWRSTHDMTVLAREIIHAYYGRKPRYSYFVGCSTGGEQGLMEAQRFPDDYDGIVAGGPASDRTHLHMDILWNFIVEKGNGGSELSGTKPPLLANAVLKACSAEKAAPADMFLSDPLRCEWDPGSLLCKPGQSENCLTKAQIETARKIYHGPIDPVTGKSIYWGLPRGSEFLWNSLSPDQNEAPYDSLFKWVFGSDWDWRTFNFHHDVPIVDRRLASSLNAVNPDLRGFRLDGHKLIVYHGWADWLVPPQQSVEYYREVAANFAPRLKARPHNRTGVEQTRDFYRLFMIPGMGHCSSGPGLNSVKAFSPLVNWVEKGTPPESLLAWREVQGRRTIARPICAYPDIARYNGVGDTGAASSFSCVSPPRSRPQ